MVKEFLPGIINRIAHAFAFPYIIYGSLLQFRSGRNENPLIFVFSGNDLIAVRNGGKGS